MKIIYCLLFWLFIFPLFTYAQKPATIFDTLLKQYEEGKITKIEFRKKLIEIEALDRENDSNYDKRKEDFLKWQIRIGERELQIKEQTATIKKNEIFIWFSGILNVILLGALFVRIKKT